MMVAVGMTDSRVFGLSLKKQGFVRIPSCVARVPRGKLEL